MTHGRIIWNPWHGSLLAKRRKRRAVPTAEIVTISLDLIKKATTIVIIFEFAES